MGKLTMRLHGYEEVNQHTMSLTQSMLMLFNLSGAPLISIAGAMLYFIEEQPLLRDMVQRLMNGEDFTDVHLGHSVEAPEQGTISDVGGEA